MMLVFCDFDHTLVEENSDTEVVRVLGGEELLLEELRELSRSEAYSGRWTELMNVMNERLHALGMTREDYQRALRGMQIDPLVMQELVEGLREHHPVHIVSDANEFYIEEVLRGSWPAGDPLPSFVVHSNGARWAQGGPLLVDPFMQNTQCRLCPRNLCKGSVVEPLLLRGAAAAAAAVYVGDGRNDWCPVKRILRWHAAARTGGPRAKVWVLPRRGMALEALMDKHGSEKGDRSLLAVPGVQVVAWESAQELGAALKRIRLDLEEEEEETQ